jgi:hypothetical protein
MVIQTGVLVLTCVWTFLERREGVFGGVKLKVPESLKRLGPRVLRGGRDIGTLESVGIKEVSSSFWLFVDEANIPLNNCLR